MSFGNQNIAFHKAAGCAANYRFLVIAVISIDVNDGPDIDDAARMSDAQQIVLSGVGIQEIKNNRARPANNAEVCWSFFVSTR